MTGPVQAAAPSGAGQSVVTIGQFFSTLRRRLLVVLTMVLLGILAAGALLLNTTKTYEATAVVDISPTSGAALSTVSTITESRIVTSASVAMAAQQTLAYTGTPTELADQVRVTSPLASQVLYITFAAETAQGAADGANAFANAYLDYRTEIAQKDLTLRVGRIQSQVADLQRSLAGVGAGVGVGQNETQRGLLQNQIQQLQNQLNNLKTSVINPGQVAGAAAVPESPSSPRPPLYLVGGLLIGLLLGIILAVVRDRRDDRVRASADLEQSLGAPVIAEFVADEGGSRLPESLAATAATRSPEADAYRTVTTAATSHSTGSRVVLLCGTGQEGLSLAPMNLAATFATQGLRTVLAGPEHAVQPAVELLEVQDAPSWPGARLADRLAPSTQLSNLLVLSLGDEVSLGSTLRANGDNLSEILAKVDIIVLDGVNIELPSTSLRLGQIADEAVVVAYKGHSTHVEIERLARQLAQVSVTVLGGILLSRRSSLLGGRRRLADRAPGRPVGGASHREAAGAGPRPAQAAEEATNAPTSSAAPTSSSPAATNPASVTAEIPRPGGSGSTSTQPSGAGSWPGGGFGSEAPPPGSPRPASTRKS
ncbi:MAG TPA: Wzz/FepE/Etk N-terminal domain-containing protein [Jatrophihabitans sp.]|jgi:capsular polysaccharide biosynthesis protein|uniref:Wzz/FepE/Etk N-terminal domain-containing protein n=1 Tax=Jatrophihabitans sp. TaxID=1932789 RepID=UPI002F03B20B